MDHRFAGPRTGLRPAPNSMDAEAAEPVFSGRVRKPEAPLLDADKLKSSSQWNRAMHPKVSGITLAELRLRLERYIDRVALDDMIRLANARAVGSYPIDDATLVTMLAHQFQHKICRSPTVGEITKPCTLEGRVAEDTLDALGFVYHAGRALNMSDRANHVAATYLAHIPASKFVGIEPGLTANTWWSYMVGPPWLGLPIKHGIHLVMIKRLRRAQRALMNLPAFANMSPAELGRALGIEEEHKGARPDNSNWSMHLFGLAIDISYTRNPWLSNPERNTIRMAEITLRAARLVGSPGAGDPGITPRYLDALSSTYQDTGKIYRILADRSRWLAEYFTLSSNPRRLEGQLPIANLTYPDGRWFKRGESLAASARRWSGIIRADFDAFANAVSRGGNKNEVRHGYMDLARELVIALRDEACLSWGAVDLGKNASGDIMHFDCRSEGIGRTIAKASGKASVPEAGSRCLPAVRAPEVRREFELLAKLPKTPVDRRRRRRGGVLSSKKPSPAQVGHWLTPFISREIPKYEDKPGHRQSTGCSINVPDSLWRQKEIDLLVFFHGNPDPCADMFDPVPKMISKKFGIDSQIHHASRKVALAVPTIFWIPNNKDGDANIKGIWTAASINRFVEEVLDQIGNQSGVRPDLRCLIIAGHSHAYGILTPLASEFTKNGKATRIGALAKLSEVWALDSTYGAGSIDALLAWAHVKPELQVTVVLNETPAKRGKKPRPIDYWGQYVKHQPRGVSLPPNFRTRIVDESHCVIPTRYVAELLTPVPWFPPTTLFQSWFKPRR